MRIPAILVALIIVVAACSSSDDAVEPTVPPSQASTTPTTTTAPEGGDATTTTAPAAIPPQLADHDIDMVVVGDQLMLLAIADSPGLRVQGLMGVTDLGDLDGMLFYWRHHANGGFASPSKPAPVPLIGSTSPR